MTTDAPPSASATAEARPTPARRERFRHFESIATRWADNDAYGHINNVVYYSYFDSVVNRYLIEAGALDLEHSEVIGLVVETHCNYYASLAFPQRIEAGLAVSRIGTSSVRYDIGLFAEAAPLAAACGHFVHVYVDRATRRPVTALPAILQRALQVLA